MLSGSDLENALRCVQAVLAASCHWTRLAEYQAEWVSEMVAKIVLGYRLRVRGQT